MDKTQESRKQQCVEFLQELLRYQTITPNECGIYEVIKSRLARAGFAFLHIDEGGVKNLFAYRLAGGDMDSSADSSTRAESSADSTHFCFMGHVDVVPVGEGWSADAFGAEVKDGFVYGRGAQDMKGGVAAFVCAMCDFIEDFEAGRLEFSLDSSDLDSSAKTPRLPSLSILLTSDEEGEGTYGTRYALEELKARGLLPNSAIVAEPTCVERLGDTIKIGRRGSINGVLKIIGKQGHVAYPEKCINPLEALGAHLQGIAGAKLDSGSEYFKPSQIIITDIRGGLEAVNVTPGEVKIMFNIRNSPLTSLQSVESYLQNIVAKIKQNAPKAQCELVLKQSAKPFITKADSALVSMLEKSIESICGVRAERSTSGGTSDARFCAEYGIDAVEFGVCNDRIHAVDERVKIDEVTGLYSVFYAFLAKVAGA